MNNQEPSSAEKQAIAGVLLAGIGFVAMMLNTGSNHPSPVLITFTSIEIVIGVFLFIYGAIHGGLK